VVPSLPRSINYPFNNDTVATLATISAEARANDLTLKFYYTVRELSNHAVELFPLLALQGEVITDNDPYTIPQPGCKNLVTAFPRPPTVQMRLGPALPWK